MPVSNDRVVKSIERVIEELNASDVIVIGARLSINRGWENITEDGEVVGKNLEDPGYQFSSIEKKFTVVWRVPARD